MPKLVTAYPGENGTRLRICSYILRKFHLEKSSDDENIYSSALILYVSTLTNMRPFE